MTAKGVGEFELIRRHFTRPGRDASLESSPVVLGIGDDCALLRVQPGMQLAVSCDMLVEGRHFLSTVAPERLGHKALAVNLSDLAACGAEPLAFTLALALPHGDETFVAALAQGLFALADAHGIELVGGDTTAGPLNLCITVFGQVPPGQALLRSGARVGDDLWVSGTLGDARLALEVFRGRVSLGGEAFERVRRAMELPQPRLALGLALRGLASSAIDLSDGLAGDLGHVLQRSGVAARVDVDALPRSADLVAQHESQGGARGGGGWNGGHQAKWSKPRRRSSSSRPAPSTITRPVPAVMTPQRVTATPERRAAANTSARRAGAAVNSSS